MMIDRSPVVHEDNAHTPAEVHAYADRLHSHYRVMMGGDDRRALSAALASIEISLAVGPTSDAARRSPAFLADLAVLLRQRLAGLVFASAGL